MLSLGSSCSCYAHSTAIYLNLQIGRKPSQTSCDSKPSPAWITLNLGLTDVLAAKIGNCCFKSLGIGWGCSSMVPCYSAQWYCATQLGWGSHRSRSQKIKCILEAVKELLRSWTFCFSLVSVTECMLSGLWGTLRVTYFMLVSICIPIQPILYSSLLWDAVKPISCLHIHLTATQEHGGFWVL